MDEDESSCENVVNVKKAIKHVWDFLEDFIPLANTHGAEFIFQSHWENVVPSGIHHHLLVLSRKQLVSLPLGLHSHPEKHEKNALENYIIGATSCHVENLDVLSSFPESDKSFKVKGVVSESMSEKKMHEVDVMANAVAGMSRNCEADVVVDIGSGKGYLSLELAGHHKMNVLGLDSSHTNTHGAEYRKEKLKTRWSALVAKTDHVNRNLDQPEDSNDKKIDSYIPVTCYVTPDMNLSSILSQHALSLCGQMSPEQMRIIVTGLHTCGSLAVSAMRLCLKDASAVAMLLVTCCYQLMEEHDTDVEGSHFPLSKFGKSLGLHLGRNARNLASQSVHRIAESGQLQGEQFYWRALLEMVIHQLGLPHPERIMGMRGLNKRNSSFIDYARKAFEKLGFPVELITPEFIHDIEEKYKDERPKMAAFFQLKLTLAPGIESLILLDRLMFLLEQPCIKKAGLVRLFDPVTSPRCYALFATKGCFG